MVKFISSTSIDDLSIDTILDSYLTVFESFIKFKSALFVLAKNLLLSVKDNVTAYL